MNNTDLKSLPFLLFADDDGIIYDHPYFRMACFSGEKPVTPKMGDLIPMPEFSKLFYIPKCPPIGLNTLTGKYEIVTDVEINGRRINCNAVAAFLEPGLVRSYLPAVDYSLKDFILPMWAYTAVGYKDDKYWSAGFRIEYNHTWDPRNYDDRKLIPAIKRYKKMHTCGPLIEHLVNCATKNHCFAAKNLFFERWEAPLPVSRTCNAACLGCISLQSDDSCQASHQRLSIRPSVEEIVSLAVNHLKKSSEAIVSFGQGCEGEPLTEYMLISDTIKRIRNQTSMGTINLNTNGSSPERIRNIIDSGLDSIRISLNSARPDFYKAYYRPKNYNFEDVVSSVALSKEMGIYTMINYLIFPGITDQQEEIDSLKVLIRKTSVNFIHFKNLNIDPQYYLDNMPLSSSQAIGIKQGAEQIHNEFPDVELGYFNQPVR